MATTAYTITLPSPEGVPAGIVVRVVAMRDDGKTLSREDLVALAAAYPPPPEARAEVDKAIADAPSRPPKATASSGDTAKPKSKRAAAKSPSKR